MQSKRAVPKCFPCTDLSRIVGRPDTPASTAGPCTSPRHDPAPATSCWRVAQPARRSSTEFLKGPWTWAAYAHVLGAQPFQNFLCSAAQKLAPHGVGPMQCRRYGYACTHFAGRDKGFTSSSSFSPMGAAWQYPRETSIVVQPSPNQAIEHGGPPRSQDHHKQNKTSP